MIKKNWISFNNFNTLSNNILIEQLPEIPLSEEKVEFIEIDGRSGYLTLSQNEFMPIEYEVQLNLKSKNDIKKIRSIFCGSGKLITSNDDTLFYYARVISVVNFERVISDKYTCIITFKLQPFGYEIENNEIASITNPYTISNNTNATCQPLITIQGSGSCILTIGNHQINITDINESIILDFETQEAYKDNNGSKENMNGKVDGVFYDFEIGNTKISWNGSGITKITVNPRYRWR